MFGPINLERDCLHIVVKYETVGTALGSFFEISSDENVNMDTARTKYQLYTSKHHDVSRNQTMDPSFARTSRKTRIQVLCQTKGNPKEETLCSAHPNHYVVI